MFDPTSIRARSLLLQPVKAVAVTLSVDDVRLAIVIYVIADNRKTGIAQLPIRMPLPLILIGINIFEPSIGSEDIGLAIAIDIGDSDTVAVLLLAAHVVHLGLRSGEVHPQNAGVVVVSQREIGLAVAVDVAQRAAFGVIAVHDKVTLPHHIRLSGILIPPQTVRHPACGHHIGLAIVVHIECPLAAIGDEFAHYANSPKLMPLPFAAQRSGILVPVGSAENVGPSVAVHVHRSDTFGVVGTQPVDEKGCL